MMRNQERGQGQEMTRLRENDPDQEMTMKKNNQEKDQDQEIHRLREKDLVQEMITWTRPVLMKMTCLEAEKDQGHAILRLSEEKAVAQ